MSFWYLYFFTENEKLKIEKKNSKIFFWNFLQQTFTTFRFYKSNCFKKNMPYSLGSTRQDMSCFEYTCVFSKIWKSFIIGSLETIYKFRNLSEQ